MTEVRIPGPEVAATPAFICSLPSGWRTQETPGALAAFTLPGAAGVSVLVSVTRVGKDVDLRDVAVRSFAQQRRAHTSVTIDSQRVGRFGDRLVYVRGVTVTDTESTAQIQGLFFGPAADDPPTADVFSLVGSCPARDISDYGPLFVDMLASISFEPVMSAEAMPS